MHDNQIVHGFRIIIQLKTLCSRTFRIWPNLVVEKAGYEYKCNMSVLYEIIFTNFMICHAFIKA